MQSAVQQVVATVRNRLSALLKQGQQSGLAIDSGSDEEGDEQRERLLNPARGKDLYQADRRRFLQTLLTSVPVAATAAVLSKVLEAPTATAAPPPPNPLPHLQLACLPRYTRTTLPPTTSAGCLAYVTDDVRGVWLSQGSQWVSAVGEVINVKEFGAKGDGSANDTLVIQAAFDAASHGGCIYFPRGVYCVSSLMLNNIAPVVITGPQSTLQQAILALNDGSPLLDLHGSDVTIQGLTFEGVRHSQPYQVDHFCDCFQSPNQMGRAYRAAIKADGTLHPIHTLKVVDCKFVNVFGACVATMDVSRVTIERSIAENCNFEFAYLYSTSPQQEAIIRGNIASHIGSGDAHVNANVFLCHDYHRVVCSGNSAEQFERNFFKLEGGHNVVVADNVIDGNRISNFAGIQVQASADTIAITGNNIYNCQAGIALNNHTPLTSVVIANNTIDTTDGDGIVFGLSTFQDVLITGNQLRSIGRHGIYTNAGGDRICITGNLISGQGDNVARWSTGIGFYITQSDVIALEITNNHLSSFPSGLVLNGVAGDGVIALFRSGSLKYRFLNMHGNTVRTGSSDGIGVRVLGDYVESGLIAHNTIDGGFEGYSDSVYLRDNLITGRIVWPRAVVALPRHLSAIAHFAVVNLPNGATMTVNVPVTGAQVGDPVSVGYASITGPGWLISAQVTARNRVTVVLLNMTGAAASLPDGTLRADVWQHLEDSN